MTECVLGIDVGGSAAKVWVHDGRAARSVSAPLATERPAPFRAEFDPGRWWAVVAGLVRDTVAARPDRAWTGVVVSSLRQGFVLTDGAAELGPGVLNSDRRGAAHLARLRRVPDLYATTGHWPAPELSLPKLLAVAAEEPDRWAATRRVLFVHDWLVWRLCGVAVTEVSYACAGQLAHVARRDWAADLLAELGLGTDRLAPLVEPGTMVGGLSTPDLGLPAGLPVYAGCGDTQLAAAGIGGLADGVVSVIAGSSTPVQAATAAPVVDGQAHAWVSTHARKDLWAAETNAGYPGTYAGWLAGLLPAEPSGRPGAGGLTATVAAPLWTERAWVDKAPAAVLGLRPDTDPTDLAQAMVEAHAYAIRSNVEDLERVLDRPATEVILAGGAARRGNLAGLCATLLGRPVRLCTGGDAAAAAGRALVTGDPVRPAGTATIEPGDPAPYAAPYERYLRAHAALRERLPEGDR